jgi:uncharacterized membrane protein YphA (DoxX/SURF4 family)
MKDKAIASRLIRVIISALFIQLLICYPLWIASLRTFPTVPVFSSLRIQWGTSLDWFMYICLLTSCVILFTKPFSRKAYLTLLLVFILFLLEDINRLQPWFYLYLIMLSSLVFFDEKNSKHILQVFRIVLSSVYFWSGLQKLNVHFAIEVFPWVADFTGAENFLNNHHFIAYFAASAEGLAGVLLWIKPLRKVGCIIAMLMHLFIIISLGPWLHNWNEIVWPWNIVFAWMVFELFYRTEPEAIKFKKAPATYHTALVLLMVAIMPAFGILGKWDHFLSDGFYSAMLNEPAFYFPLAEAERLPTSSEPYQYLLEKENRAILLINYWCLDDLKVPLYPEDRVYREVAKKLSLSLHDMQSTGLRITYKSRMNGNLTETNYPFANLNLVK